MNTKLWLICVLTLGLAQIGFGQQVPLIPQSDTDSSGYLVGVGDVVSGKVLGESDFDFTAEVDTDGKLQIPFLDRPIQAKCRTEKELRADVKQALARYLKTPQISVRVVERRSRPPVIITGEVRLPQQVELRREARLLDILSQAGGETGDADGMIQVFRTQQPMCSEKNETAEKNDSAIWRNISDTSLDVPSRMFSLANLRGGKSEDNPVIQSGDVIIVQKARPVYITGEVTAPQGILLKEGGTTLMDAIAKVNGVNRQAKTKDIKIYRLKPDSKDREIISVNYDTIKKGEQKDILLQPYDIVEVGKAKKPIAQTILEIATGVGMGAVNTLGQGLPNRILY
jgi:polysaccharide export outer membrane protein